MNDGSGYGQAVADFMADLCERHPHEPQFHQAVEEVVSDIIPFVAAHPEYQRDQLLRRLTEPDRSVTFRVTWEDDQGEVHVNRGMRVQFNSALGPYKGGLRFVDGLAIGTLKFLGFEQTFKNALTGMPIGGGKGGSDFDPKGRSDREIMRFCQAFMTELVRHIGPDTDVPAGDQGVGSRELNYLFGQYRRITSEYTGVLTGKGIHVGGSALREEATGYGAVYFATEMLKRYDDTMEGKTCVVSGSGNVTLFAIEKAIELGAKVVTVSDTDGFVYDPAGIDAEKLAWLKALKLERRGRVREYAEHFTGVEYHPGRSPWQVPCDLAFPCATQQELDGTDAEALVAHGVRAVVEGANMPCTAEATHIFRKHVLYAPGKASNAGGVAVSALEQSQHSMRLRWSREEVDERLHTIMRDIHGRCVEYGEGGERIDYMKGANLAGFIRVADAVLAQGLL